MVKMMSLNDDQFRQIMVGDNAAENGDGEDQYKDRHIQDGDQAVSCQAPLYHSGNDQAVTRNVSASQEQLVSDVVDSNMATKKGKKNSAYPKMGPDEVSLDQRETKLYGLRRRRKQTEKGVEYRRNTLEERGGKLHSRLLRKSSAIDVFISEY